MNIERLIRASLWLTAPANLVVAGAFAFPSATLGAALEFPAGNPFYTAFCASFIALFGVTYAWMALQPHINRPLLVLGTCGKLIAVLISGALFAAGELSGVTASLISLDLVFVALWIFYLLRGPDSSDA